MDREALLAGLNPEQRTAVTHRGGPLLVLAGAGSGKTRVVTVRIADLVATGVAPDHVLALTFTNKAAAEMGERVAGLVGRDAAERLTVRTFHALGLRIVEEEAQRLGLTRPITLLDAADQHVAVRHCLKAEGIDPRRHDPRLFLSAISNARNAGQSPEDLARRPGGPDYTARVYRAYLDWLAARGALDFDDLLLRPVQLLRDHEDLRDKWRARFRHVLVDEYQDTNRMQLELLHLLADEHRQLCVVGDDDQAIYGWRGARLDNILRFEEHFPDATAIALERNYRSTGHILDAAHALIQHNDARRPKKLWTEGERGELVHVIASRGAPSEASFVAGEIRRRRHDEARPWDDFGVLFRTAGQAQPLEEALRLADVPYRVVGVSDFFQRKEVKDVLSYLRLVHNPRDRASFSRVVNFPRRGIGPRRLEAVLRHAREHGLSPLEACARARDVPGVGSGEAAALEGFHELIRQLRERYHREEASGRADLAGLAETLCERLDARTAWIRDPTEGPGGHARWHNVQKLLAGLRRWQERNPSGDLGDWLQSVALEGRNRQENATEEAHQAVTLLTMHAAKGLEWPITFVVGCQEGYLPHQRVLEESRDLDEERRLFYVAMTRAREVLYLTRARERRSFRGTEPARPSRFLEAIPDEHRADEDVGAGGRRLSREEAKERFAELRARLARHGG